MSSLPWAKGRMAALVGLMCGVLGGCAAIVVATSLLEQYGLYALAIGYAVGEAVQAIGLGVMLPRSIRHSVARSHASDVTEGSYNA